MGLLDSVIGGLLGSGGGASPIQGVLMSMLSGGGQAQQGGFDVSQKSAGMSGGLSGLLSSFQTAGLGRIAQSWVSNGPNQAVSPQQLQTVFGDQQVQSMANQSGMAPNDFLSQLAEHLPNAVNGLTPSGRIPDEGTMSV